jgi:hypothetical protein
MITISIVVSLCFAAVRALLLIVAALLSGRD